ncbi:MAG: helix-turn-helix transcriptional regulator [Bacteroidia bacterium]|nr:helix-turn-helix transcriptional regulator [Bacteroidia bacterium]
MKKKLTVTKKQKPTEVLLLGKRIKQLRQNKGYSSQETFAYDNDYTLSYYSRIERGEDIRFTSLVKVSKALGVDLEMLFSEGFEGLNDK